MRNSINKTSQTTTNYFPDTDNSSSKKVEDSSPPTHKRSLSAEECKVHVRGSAAWLSQRALRNNQTRNQSPPAPAALGTQGTSKRLPKWTPPAWSKERMRTPPDLDALYGSVQPPRAKPGRASEIQKTERSMKDGMVKINAARIILNPNITPNLPQLRDVVCQEVKNGRVFKWTVSRNKEVILTPYKLSDNTKQLVLAAPIQSGPADKIELMPGQSEFIQMVIDVLKQIVRFDENDENKLSDHSTQVAALIEALKKGKLTLGHPTLIGGFKEPEGRAGGEFRYGKLEDNSEPTFYINNDSGRYGEYEDRDEAILKNIAKCFENHFSIPVKEQWIAKEKVRLVNKPIALAETSSLSGSASDPSLNMNSSSKQDELVAENATLQRSASFNGNRTGLLKSLPFNSKFLHEMESETETKSKTLKWGTPELPRLKNGKSTIKFFEREGNVETGKPKINTERFFIDENQEISPEIIEALENVRNGGPMLVFGIDKDGRFVAAPETLVPDVKWEDEDGNSVEARLGHTTLVGGEELRISGEISMRPYKNDHPLYDPENPDKKLLVLINKSGRYGREGVRTEEQLLNVEAFLAKRGAKVDEVIFRKKKDGVVSDTLLQRRIERSRHDAAE